jgi:MFS family permease
VRRADESSETAAAPAAIAERANSARSPFGVLRQREFRWLLASNLAQYVCFQVSMLAMQWLVTELTPSRALLGAIGFVQGGAVALASPWSGVIADRSERRRLLLFGRIGMALLIAGTAALIALERIEIWHLALAAVLGGLLSALLLPATQTAVYDLVGRERVQRAVALNATGAGIAQAGGPALAGVLIAAIGVLGAYLVSASGLAAAALALFALPLLPPRARAGGAARAPGAELREALTYTRNSPPILLAFAACAMAIFNGCMPVMRPVFARHELGVGSEELGYLLSTGGIGTLTAAVLATLLPQPKRCGLRIAGSMLGFALCILLYASVETLPQAMAVEFGLGLSGQLWNVWAFSGIQLAVPDALRGRMVSLVATLAQLGFIAQLGAGWLADRAGDRSALLVFGGIPSLCLIAMLAFGHRTLRKI